MYTVYHLPKSLGRSCRSTHVLNPQYGLHKQAVVPRRHPRVTLPARKQVLDGLPLVIAQKQSQDGLVPEKPLVSHASG